MAPPNIVRERAQAIHRALLEAGWASRHLPRRDLEAYAAVELGLSLPTTRVLIDQGRVLRLWSLVDRRPKPSALLIHPATAAPATPTPAPTT